MKKTGGTQQISTKTNNQGVQKNIVVQEIESYNAPPLDFSYKNIKDLQELRQLEPRQVLQQVKQGKKYVIEQKAAPRKPIIVEVEQKEDPKAQGEEKEKEETKEEQNTEEKKEEGEEQNKVPEILRLIPNNNVNNFVAQIPLYSGANKQSSSHAKDEEHGAQSSKKVVRVKQIQSQLILSYNKIGSVACLPEVVPTVMLDNYKLQWIDLSHNYLVDLDLDFSVLTHLSSLYLHCNYIKDLNQFVNLSRNPLRNLTVHGNPVETIPNFRLYLTSILLQLKKLDTVLISKKERDDSNVFLVKFNMRTKAFPEVKDAQQPPKEEEAEPAKN